MSDRDSSGGQAKANKSAKTDTDAQAQDGAQAQDDAVADVAERHEKLTDDVDAMLDEIDGALETNAEDFVKQFVQKGGE